MVAGRIRDVPNVLGKVRAKLGPGKPRFLQLAVAIILGHIDHGRLVKGTNYPRDSSSQEKPSGTPQSVTDRHGTVYACPSHRVDRVLFFFSCRRYWDSPIPSPAGECAPPLDPGGTLARRERGWGSPNTDEGTYTVRYM